MNIKLVAIDLDDTLLDTKLKVSPQCIAAINAVRDKGIYVTIATGRMYRSALPYAEQIGVEIPLITYQGALVKNSQSGEVLYNKSVPREQAVQVLDYLQRKGVHYQAYFNDRLCMKSLSQEGRDYIDLCGISPVIIEDLVGMAEKKDTPKIMMIVYDAQKLQDIEKEMNGMFGDRLVIIRSKPFYLEIMDQYATKADALQVVANHYKIKQNEVLAIGDSYNDLSMLAWAGIGVAMGNAPDQIKHCADYITATNEEEGVAEALHRFILN